jgi:hypothetical protein
LKARQHVRLKLIAEASILKSPVRENRTPGSARGRSGNWPSYRYGQATVKAAIRGAFMKNRKREQTAIDKLERSFRNTKIGLCIIVLLALVSASDSILKFFRSLRDEVNLINTTSFQQKKENAKSTYSEGLFTSSFELYGSLSKEALNHRSLQSTANELLAATEASRTLSGLKQFCDRNRLEKDKKEREKIISIIQADIEKANSMYPYGIKHIVNMKDGRCFDIRRDEGASIGDLDPVATFIETDPLGQEIRFQITKDHNVNFIGNWLGENIVKYKIPQLNGVDGYPEGGIFIHKAMEEDLRKIMEELEKRALLKHIYRWTGSLKPKVQGSTTEDVKLSHLHKGLAISFIAKWDEDKNPELAKRGSLENLDLAFMKYCFMESRARGMSEYYSYQWHGPNTRPPWEPCLGP